MVFQSYALYPHMTVRRNIESPCSYAGTRSTGPTGRPQAVCGPSATSGSTRRPGSSASTTCSDASPPRCRAGSANGSPWPAPSSAPQAFLMDEPLSNLDAKLRAATRLELVDLHRRVQTTVVYVTHDQVEAMTMADRIAIMSAGRLQQVGTPQDVYDAPANLFVAQFIGTPPMNTLPGTITTAGGAPAVDVGGGGRVPPAWRASLAEGQPVVVGIPPRGPGRRRRRAGRAEGAGRRVAGPRVPDLRHDRRVTRRRPPGRHGLDRDRRRHLGRRRPPRRSTSSTPTRRTPRVTEEAVFDRRRQRPAQRSPAGTGAAGCCWRPRSPCSWRSSTGRSSTSCTGARSRAGANGAYFERRRPQPVPRGAHQRRLPRGPVAQRPVRALHGARRHGPRRAAGRGRPPAAEGHQDLPGHLQLDPGQLGL